MNSFASHLCGHGGERGRQLGGVAATVGCERSAFEGLPLKGSEEKAGSEKGQQQAYTLLVWNYARLPPDYQIMSQKARYLFRAVFGNSR